jgi:hypothetical protein
MCRLSTLPASISFSRCKPSTVPETHPVPCPSSPGFLCPFFAICVGLPFMFLWGLVMHTSARIENEYERV